MYFKSPLFNANSLDPVQTLHSVPPDLGLHCLPVSILWDARHKWVNMLMFSSQAVVCLYACCQKNI